MAFRTQKISQMTPKGADLEATDLIEVSTIESGSYVTRSITGQELIDAIPPTTIEWGDIGGTLSDQTDLQSALDAKVPTSRTLTINGTTQDLSADRTFTISTGITIGSTAITSGVVGRVLFQGTGNVVQQSSSLFWDATNNRLGIGTSSPLTPFDVIATDATILFRNTSSSGYAGINMLDDTNTLTGSFQIGGSGVGSGLAGNMFIGARKTNGNLLFVRGSAATISATLFGSTGNFAIGTNTDAGFRLDVNGTGRFSGNLTVATGFQFLFNNNNVGLYRDANTLRLGGFGGIEFLASATNISAQSIRMKIFDTGNVGINTTTDAGFRLDVNGTARVSGQGSGTEIFIVRASVGNEHCVEVRGNMSTTGSYFRAYKSGSDYPYEVNVNGVVIRSSGNTALNASSVLDLQSTTRGFLPPRMTTTQKNAIATPAAGLMVYDTTLNVISYYNGTMWV